MKQIEIRPNGSKRVITLNKEPSRTDQSFKKECDINNIMRKYRATGQVAHLSARKAVYGDFSMYGDYQDCLNKAIGAQELFNALPADVRKRFGQNPQQLLDFVADASNRDEAIKLGLIDKPLQGSTAGTPDVSKQA